MADLQTQMKQAVADAAVQQIRDGMVLGLGSGSTAALMIKALGAKLASGELKDIVAVTTSFQGEVLAAELNIPLLSLNAVQRIDLAIDGADEVDPGFQLIKGGGACHVQEKLVAARAETFVVVVDSTKLVDRLNLGFLLPVEVRNMPPDFDPSSLALAPVHVREVEGVIFVSLADEVLVGEITDGTAGVRCLEKRLS